MQSEPSCHVIPLWSYIANLELYKGERDHNDTTAKQDQICAGGALMPMRSVQS